MKVIILAGGLGTRLSELTEIIPKPMIRIGDKPMLWHIMKIYSYFGIKDFYLALGYKSEMVKNYFLHYKELNSNLTVDLSNNSVVFHKTDDADWKIVGREAYQWHPKRPSQSTSPDGDSVAGQ